MSKEESSESSNVGDDNEDDKKRLVLPISCVPLDLVLDIITHLPSWSLFEFRRLCKAAQPRVMLALDHRPFFIVQKKLPSSLCYLLPLDPPCTPLSSSFILEKPTFRLFCASGNLLCLHRQYPLLLDICVCNIFRKWKIVLPPIVHPRFASGLTRRIFVEDDNVEHLCLVGFYAEQSKIKTDEEGAFCPGYRVFVASNKYLRMFDSHVNRWSDPVYFPSQYINHRYRSAPKNSFATCDGNLILTFSFRRQSVVFNYEDRSFHAMEPHLLQPAFEVAGYPATAEVDSFFSLKVQFPHIKECVRSSPETGLVLTGSCESEFSLPRHGSYKVFVHGVLHQHLYRREFIRSFCHAYQGKVYVLVLEMDEFLCKPIKCTKTPVDDDEALKLGVLGCSSCPLISKKRAYEQFCPPIDSCEWEDKEWHDLKSFDVKKYFYPGEDASFDCANIFPARLARKATLYSACIDTEHWTMKVSREADASACFEIFDFGKKEGTFSLISG